MPTTQEDFDAFETALKNNKVENLKNILQNFDVAATDNYGWNCLMLCGCWSKSPEVVKVVFAKIDEAGGPDLIKSLAAATDKFGQNCVMRCGFSNYPEVAKVMLKKIDETGGPGLLKSLVAAIDSKGRNCLMLCSSFSRSPEVVKLFAVVLFHVDLLKIQYLKLDDNYKNTLKERAGIDSSSWTPDAASLAEVKAILQRADPHAPKKKVEEEGAAKMPMTQEDFNAFRSAVENNKIEDLNKILQNFDLTATDNFKQNCLMLCGRYSSSPEVIKIILEKIEQTGGPDLLKSQLAATDNFGQNCVMHCGLSSSPEVAKVMLKKIDETGGPGLLKSLVAAIDNKGRNCLMLCNSFSPSPEVVKLFAVVLFHVDLFKIQYPKLNNDHDKKKLKEKAGIHSSSWAPDAASLAEVKAILQGADTTAAEKNSEEEAAAKKKAEEEAAAKKKAAEEAAAKKKAEEEAAKKAHSQQQPQDQTTIDVAITADSPPPTNCFKRGVPPKNLEDSVTALMSIKEAPENRPDLNDWVPDKNDCDSLLHYLNTSLKELKERPAIKKLIAENGLTDDDIKILHSYKIQNPFPVYLWLNGWLGGDRRDDFVKQNVAPYFTLLYRAMEKLPKITTTAYRGIKLNDISSLQATYDNYEKACAPGKNLSFWGFSSFSTKDDVVTRKEFIGESGSIIYSCESLTGVDMEPFAPKGLKDESEILPLCPCVLEVKSAVKFGKKLIVGVKQLDHANYSYVVPK